MRKFILCFFSLIVAFARPFLRKRDAAVLMYHSISDSGWFFAVSPKEFEQQMRYIKERYSPVTLLDVADFLERGKGLPPRAVAVTFDDGYRDFLTYALPILEQYKIPATIFVSAGEPDRAELGNEFPLLSGEEVKRLAARPLVEIGSHAVTHRKLKKLPPDEAENEIHSSRVLLKERTGGPVAFFAYPKGSFNGALMDMVRRAGYRAAVTAEQYLVRRGTDIFAVPRVQVDASVSFFELRARLTPATDWYHSLWKIKEKFRRRFSF